jgi:hypothetical protein
VSERVPTSLLSALTDLVGWLEGINVPSMAGSSMIIGGVAASILGRPRLTQDIDALLLLDEAQWEKALDQAALFGIIPRINTALEFARRARVLLLRHTESGIDIDVALGGLSFEHEAVQRSSIYDIAGIRVRLPSVEDLMIMKAVAHRPKDIEDIDGLLTAHPNVDLNLVRKWVREFANAMTMPDLLEDFEKVVTRQIRR